MVMWVVALAGLVVALAVWLVRSRRVRVRSCCPADPARDLRMRGAFEDDAQLGG